MSPLVGLGTLWVRLGRFDEAREAARRLMTDCTHAESQVQGHLQLASVEARAGDVGLAEQHCREAAENEEESVGALAGIADRAEKDEAWATAAALYRRAADLSPEQRDAATAHAVQCLLKAGDRAAAEDLSEQAGESAELAIVMAKHVEDAKEWEAAAEWHGKVAELSADNRAAALEHVGDIFLKHFRPPECAQAEAAYRKAIEATPESFGPRAQLIRILGSSPERTDEFNQLLSATGAILVTQMGTQVQTEAWRASRRLVWVELVSGHFGEAASVGQEVADAVRRSPDLRGHLGDEAGWAVLLLGVCQFCLGACPHWRENLTSEEGRLAMSGGIWPDRCGDLRMILRHYHGTQEPDRLMRILANEGGS